MTQLDSIQTAWTLSLLFGAGTGSVLILRWLWERITVFSEIAAMLISLVAAPILLATVGDEWQRIAIMAALSTCAAIGITFVSTPTDPTVLNCFYRQVSPLGWWRQMAMRVGDAAGVPLHRFSREIRTTGLVALSLFLALIGCGKLLLHLPDEPRTWAWIAMGVAAMLVPLWRRDALTPAEGDS